MPLSSAGAFLVRLIWWENQPSGGKVSVDQLEPVTEWIVSWPQLHFMRLSGQAAFQSEPTVLGTGKLPSSDQILLDWDSSLESIFLASCHSFSFSAKGSSTNPKLRSSAKLSIVL